MRTSSKTMFLAVMLTIASVIGSFSKGVNSGLGNVSSMDVDSRLRLLQEQEDADQRLGQYVVNMMYKAGAGKTISDGLKLSIARAIVRVANDIFDTKEARKGWITALSIESGFNRIAQSPTGPKGYGQLAKSAFFEAIKSCGLGDVRESDVWDTELNLYASACYFHQMLERSDNDPYVAIVLYNQGPNSEAAKQYAKHGTMDNVEALKYVARFNFLKRKVDEKQMDGVPSISELPVPSAPKSDKAKAAASKVVPTPTPTPNTDASKVAEPSKDTAPTE